MLGQRILSALVGMPLLLGIIYLSGSVLLLAVIILVVFGMNEYKNIIERSGWIGLKVPLWLSTVVFPLATILSPELANLLVFGYFLTVFTVYLIGFPRYTPVDLAVTLLGALYVSWSFSHILFLRNVEEGFWLLIYVFIVVWSTDTGAYFTGMSLGRHKLAPTISPKKTWEGFFGGLLFSWASAYLLLKGITLPAENQLLLITPFISVAGQVGDLFESSLKRVADIKDSSNIIPGHGGILDRFDSTLWAIPLTYYLIQLVGWR